MLIDEARALPVSGQMKLLNELSESTGRAFWNPKSLAELISDQNVKPANDQESFKAEFWPENETVEDFLAYTRKERTEALLGES